MSIQEVSAEDLARLFHHYQEALAHDNGCSNDDSCWDQTPREERQLMIAAARLALLELANSAQHDQNRKYFAKPGEADWGC